MTAPVFVDTNVLVYLRDRTEPEKQARAARWLGKLWELRLGRLSYQVLQEYYVTATLKLDPPRAVEDVREDILALLAWGPVETDRAAMEEAWRIQDRHGLSWWDALIVAAALRAGCAYLLTEDLQDGQTIQGLTVVSPFRVEPEAILPAARLP